MKLATLAPPDRGSLSVVYSCPACGYEMAMLTNPYETQIVQSLGVKVGGAAAEGAAADDHEAPGTDAAPAGSRCPFAGMIGASDAPGAAPGGPGEATSGGFALPGIATGAATAGGGAATAPAATGAADPIWTDTASERMKAIPAFVRPMARTGIERFARERGYATIDEKVLEEARAFFGM
jgi:hypothetical protein